ncbi:MAG: hypothetical protein HWE26_09955 [Alteromonadaceae bacterium]|nr:hypothetical protein [Alteromonadaceae bacterium]
MNNNNPTDWLWKCLAVAIFSTSAILACSNSTDSQTREILSSSQSSLVPALSGFSDVSPGQYVKKHLLLTNTQESRLTSEMDSVVSESDNADKYSAFNNQIYADIDTLWFGYSG